MEYYGAWARDELMKVSGWIQDPIKPERLFVHLYDDERWLRRLLEQFPEADADGDGTITAEEAVRWHANRVPPLTPMSPDLRWLPDNVSHWKEVVTAADGAKLALQVYLPAGEGPFPVLVGRGVRRGGQMDCAHYYLARGFAAVQQDIVPEDAEVTIGAHGARSSLQRDTAADTEQLLEWVARQPWCNGRIGIFGYSAGGVATLPVLNRRPSVLTSAVIHISCTDSRSAYRMRGGLEPGRQYTRGALGSWAPGDPPDPRHDRLRPIGPDESVSTCYTNIAGWFDIFVQGAIDDWLAWRPTGRAVLVVGGGTHGAHPQPSRVPPDYSDADVFWPDVPQFNLLSGGIAESSIHSVMYYFLMGDFTDPEAPGNRWQVTTEWPLPHIDRSLFLEGDGTLGTTPPAAPATAEWAYDPNNPVERVDLAWRSLIADGPCDQRPLRDRDDVVYFVGEELSEPLWVIGRLEATLYLETDVPDTSYMVKLLDIYPDGYEAMIGQGVLMARYRDGFDSPKQMVPGEVAEVKIDLWSTAIVFAPGHRVGVYVTSSDAGRYQVHPNTWDAVESYEGAPVAHNTLHLSADHPSRITIPVVDPAETVDYDPASHRPCRKTAYWEK